MVYLCQPLVPISCRSVYLVAIVDLLYVDFVDIPTQERVEHWNYLQRIIHHLPRDAKKLPIGIVIGGNCPKALQLLETILRSFRVSVQIGLVVCC